MDKDDEEESEAESKTESTKTFNREKITSILIVKHVLGSQLRKHFLIQVFRVFIEN